MRGVDLMGVVLEEDSADDARNAVAGVKVKFQGTGDKMAAALGKMHGVKLEISEADGGLHFSVENELFPYRDSKKYLLVEAYIAVRKPSPEVEKPTFKGWSILLFPTLNNPGIKGKSVEVEGLTTAQVTDPVAVATSISAEFGTMLKLARAGELVKQG